MQTLFPEIKPYKTEYLEVGDGHRVYLEQSGSVDGLPVVYVHGGPGTGSTAYHRRFFDPDKYRIILFDQRGCGHSSADDTLKANTTQHLLQDMETIRQHLGIDQWLLFGGGWGATLALLYAQQNPQHALGLGLHSVFLARQSDIDWIFKTGVPRLVPDYWQEFVQSLHKDDQHDVLEAFFQRIEGDDELARMAAAKSWAVWYARSSLLHHSSSWLKRFNDPHVALTTARVQSHFFRHDCFLEPDQVLSGMAAIADKPGILVHGRFDLLCPLDSSLQLQQHWPAAELHLIRDASHANLDPGITDALVRAAKDMHRIVTHDCTDSTSD